METIKHKTKAILLLFVIAIFTITFTGVAKNANAAVITINFDNVDASDGPVTGAVLDTYLGGFGISITEITPSGLGEIVDDRFGFPSQVVRAFSDSNVFWHDSLNDPYSYRVNFSTPLDTFSFIRPELFGTASSGRIVAPWRARAFDSSDALIDTVSEPLLAFFGSTPAVTFSLTGPDIAYVRFDRNTVNTIAELNRVPTDNWVLEFTPAVPEPTSLLLLGSGLAGLVGLKRKHRKS